MIVIKWFYCVGELIFMGSYDHITLELTMQKLDFSVCINQRVF